MPASPTAAVVGAGSSGIAAAKALHERGAPSTVFDASDRVGGDWVFGNRNGMLAAYRQLHINTSRERIEYSDFPMPKSVEHTRRGPKYLFGGPVEHPELDNVYFVALVQPLEATMPIAEAPGQWIVDELRGEYVRPSRAAMLRAIAAENERKAGTDRARAAGYVPSIAARA